MNFRIHVANIFIKILLFAVFSSLLLGALFEILTRTCPEYQPVSEDDVALKRKSILWKLAYNKNRLLDTKNCLYKKRSRQVLLPIGEMLRRGTIQKMSNGIPRILHTTWKTRKLLNAEWDLMAKVCRDSNRNFTFCHWDDDELEVFIASFYPEFLSKYLSYPYAIQRADASRYLLLHRFGGFYKDTNIGCSVPFDLIYNHALQQSRNRFKVLLLSPNSHVVAADFLASTPYHPFFTYLLKNLKTRQFRFGLPYLDVMMGTGPLFLGQSINSFFAESDIPRHSKENIAFLEKEMFEKRYFYFGDGGTWHCLDGRLIWWCSNNQFLVVLISSSVLLLIVTFVLAKKSLFPHGYLLSMIKFTKMYQD